MFLLIERNLTLLEPELLNSGGHLYCDFHIPRHSPYDNHYNGRWGYSFVNNLKDRRG